MHTSCRATGSAWHTHPLLDEHGHGLRSRDGSLSLYLPPHPYRLLCCLAQCPPGRVVPYDELQRAVFEVDEVLPPFADDRLRYHVATLRRIAVIGGWPASIVITRADVGLQLDARLWQRQTPGD